MQHNEPLDVNEQEPQGEANKKKSTAVMNALLIGFMIGIVIYSAVNNSLGFFTLIPLYFAYRLINKSKKQEPTPEG